NASAHNRALGRIGARLAPALLRQPLRRRAEQVAALDQRARRALGQKLRERGLALVATVRRLPSIERPMRQALAQLEALDRRAALALRRRSRRDEERLARLGRLFVSLDPDRPLD